MSDTTPSRLDNLDAAAMNIHYTDERIRRLAEARYRLTGNDPVPFGVLIRADPCLIEEARDWLRVAVAAGLLPAKETDRG